MPKPGALPQISQTLATASSNLLRTCRFNNRPDRQSRAAASLSQQATGGPNAAAL
jgi:hypothetical protein